MFPGALGAQTLDTMRDQLLTEVGQEKKGGGLQGIAIPYFRQYLHKKSTGPQQRELLTLLSAVDAIMAGRPAAAVDMLLQRVKSCESMLAGSHWTVSQRLEILGQETATVVPLEELTSAQREVYQESKARSHAAQADGRPSSYKGLSKGRGEGKDGQPKGGKDRRPGKGGKGEQAKKGKEEGGSKRSQSQVALMEERSEQMRLLERKS